NNIRLWIIGTLQEQSCVSYRNIYRTSLKEGGMSEVFFRGESGRLHRFSAHHPDENFPVAAAVYAFVRPSSGGRGWTPVFLSRTGNLATRLGRHHERWSEAQMLGATHILVHQSEERDAREFVEADLLASLKPVLNTQVIDAEPTRVRKSGTLHLV